MFELIEESRLADKMVAFLLRSQVRVKQFDRYGRRVIKNNMHAPEDSPKGPAIDFSHNPVVANLFANKAIFIWHSMLPRLFSLALHPSGEMGLRRGDGLTSPAVFTQQAGGRGQAIAPTKFSHNETVEDIAIVYVDA